MGACDKRVGVLPDWNSMRDTARGDNLGKVNFFGGGKFPGKTLGDNDKN